MNAPFDQLSTWLKEHRITEVECVISDLTGIARGKIAPTAKFLHERGMRLPESVLLQTSPATTSTMTSITTCSMPPTSTWSAAPIPPPFTRSRGRSSQPRS